MKVEEGRLAVVGHGPALSGGRSYAGFTELVTRWQRVPFVGTAQYRLTGALHDPGAGSRYTPVRFTGRLRGIGRTSFLMQEDIHCTATNQLLVSSLQTCITVSRETRRPEPHPDWFVKKFQHLAATNQNYLFEPYKPAALPPPFGGNACALLSLPYIIAHSDMDYNMHCGNNSYIRFCLDSAFQHEALAQFCRRPVEALGMSYRVEADVGGDANGQRLG